MKDNDASLTTSGGAFLYSEIRMQEFRTHDLSLAATLLNEKCHLLDVDRSQSRTAFVFDDTDHLRTAVDQYWRDTLLCPAQSLLASLRKAKHILYDYQPNNSTVTN